MSIATISYGGSTIATINEDAEINLETQSKYMTDDVTVVVDYPEVWDGSYTSPITDLTGTTWLFNEIISLDDVPTSVTDWQINYTYVLQDAADGARAIYKRYVPQVAATILYLGDRLQPYAVLDSGSAEWLFDYNVYNRQISFTGGAGVTNPDIISWIQANATQIS